MLPRDFAAAVGVVLHRNPFYRSRLVEILGRKSALSFTEPLHGAPIVPGQVYIAPRDQHMAFDGGRILLDRGPKIHFTRPAADRLFSSAAASYGPRVVGLVLSGTGEDCLTGLVRIKARGGLALVQDPNDAEWREMPVHSISQDHVDGVYPLEELGPVLVALTRGSPVPAGFAGSAEALVGAARRTSV
jgi:two-component system chemotaxis response regulator CheB